jgi:hypothetical protein
MDDKAAEALRELRRIKAMRSGKRCCGTCWHWCSEDGKAGICYGGGYKGSRMLWYQGHTDSGRLCPCYSQCRYPRNAWPDG